MCLHLCDGVPFRHKLQNKVILWLSPSENVKSHSSDKTTTATKNAGYICYIWCFCNFLSPPSEWRLVCCLVLFRTSNQSHLLSPGEGLYTGQFVTTILLNLGSHRWLHWALFMHGWSMLQGPHWHTYWQSIASIPRNKDQVLGLIMTLFSLLMASLI